MADNVIANPGAGGSTFRTDDLGGAPAVHVAASKIITGADGVDGGWVTVTNGFPVRLTNGSAFYTAPSSTQLPAALGQLAMAASVSVAIASDQSAVPVSAASLPLPAGASTEATLSAVSGKLPAALTAGGNLKVSLAESTASQAVTGTVTANAGSGTFAISAAALPLPSGAATEATLAARIPVNGQAAMAASVPVVIASNQSTLPVKSEVQIDYDSGAGTQSLSVVGLALPGAGGSVAGGTSTNPLRTDPTGTTTQPVSGTVTANAGTGTFTVSGAVTQSGVWTVAQGTAAAVGAPWPVRLSDGAAYYDGTKTGQLPSALVSGRLDVNIGASSATVPVSVAATVTTDPSDRAGRLVGVVYGSQGQQLRQTATNFNLQSELAVGGTLIDPRSIRALTSADVVTSAQGTAAALAGRWPVIITDGTNTMPTGDAVGRALLVRNTDGTNIAAVKAASTAAVAADPALVVALSPNNNTLANALFIKNTDGTSTASVKAASTAAVVGDPSLVVALSPNTAVTPPTLTKGTQGATGFSVQPLRDAGRVLCSFTASAVTGVTTEGLISLTPYRDLTAGGAATTHAVTANKKLRLQTLTVTWRNNTAAAGGVTVRFRMLAGTVLVSSPVHLSANATTSLATAGSGTTTSVNFPEGFEISGTMQFGLTQISVGAVVGFDVHVTGYEY